MANFIEIGFALVTHTQKRGENEQFFFKEENILGNGITQASFLTAATQALHGLSPPILTAIVGRRPPDTVPSPKPTGL